MISGVWSMRTEFCTYAKSAILVSLMLLGAFLVVATGTVSAAQDGDYIYTTSGSPLVATITGYTGVGDAIAIPSTLGGYPTVAIGNNAFNSVKGHLITSVTIPSSVTSIGDSAFYSCTSLTSVTIPNNLTSIGDSAFYSCTSIDPVSIPNGVTTIGYAAFDYCTSLTSMIIPDSVTSIGDSAFESCTSLTSVMIGSGVTSIGSSMFGSCSSLASVTIGSSVISIGDWAFSDCNSLTSVVIPVNVTYIGEWAFGSCTSLTSVMIGSGVTSIGANAFSYCTSLASVAIPSSVTLIGNGLFFNCTSLTAIDVNAGNPNYASVDGVLYDKAVTNLIQCPGGKVGALIIPSSVISIEAYAFYLCTSISSVTIPNGVTSIGDAAFDYCTSLAFFVIPSNVTTIGDFAFDSCRNLTAIDVNASNPNYASIEGVLYNKAVTTLIQCPGGKAGAFAIPDSVASIRHFAFAGCASLTDVIISDNVSFIGARSFDSCTSLTSVTIGSGVTTIEDYTFVDCTSLASVAIPDSVQTIGTQAFAFCTSLTSVMIGNGVTSIKTAAFLSCVSLINVTIGSGVTSIMYDALGSCTSLSSITFLGLVAPTAVDEEWILDSSAGVRGHAYAASNLPAPGGYFHGLTMGAVLTTAPGVPAGLSATPGNAQVTLNWTAPMFNGGSVITGYRVYRSTSEAGTYTLIASQIGLNYTDANTTNGHSYWYNVSAVNVVGEGAKTGPVSSSPFTIPNAPTGLTAVAGNAQVTLNWTEPAFNGGRVIDYYVVYQDSVALSDYPTGLSTVIAGLNNGQSYSFAVAAHNLAGNGSSSEAASSTPRAVPGAPTGLTAVPGNAQVLLNWTAPALNGGSEITNYTVYRGTTSGGETLLTILGNALALTDTSLSNGQIYYYKVSASNAAGEGAKSIEASATPATMPTAPRGLQASAGDAVVDLNWTVPEYVGPGTLTYHLFRDGSLIWDGLELNYQDADVSNGITYAYKVSANNSVGWGENSTIVLATPMSDEQRPTAPRNLTATAGLENVTLTWDAPTYSNASAVSGYVISYGISSDSLTNQITWNQLVYVFDGLTKGTTYYFKVAAQNSAGWGMNSSVESATPYGVPSAPLGLGAIAGNNYILLNWTAPSYIGSGTIAYHLFRDGSPIWNGTAVVYLDMPLAKNISFSYQLSAENSFGRGPNCTAVAATPFGPPDAPWGLRAISGNANMSLSWNPVNYSGPGNLTYHLFRDGALVWSGAATNYSDSGLINGRTYHYNVAASNSVSWGANSSVLSSAPQGRPTAPTGLQADAGNGFVQLNWTAPLYVGPGPLKYHLFRNGALVFTGSVMEYNDTNTVNFVDYSYQVTAENSIGWGPNSTAVYATPLPDEMRPTAPLNLKATPGKENVTLTWEAPEYSNASAVFGFMISFGLSNNSMTNHITWNQLAYVLDGLNKGVTYYFSVKAQNSAGWGGSSSIESTTPFGAPNEPTNLSAIAGNAQVTLSWNASSYSGPGSLSYHLFRDGVLVWSGNALSYIDAGLTNGQAYSYKVSISNDVGWGPNSTEIQATPLEPVVPGLPTNFHVSTGNDFVSLSWGPPTLTGTAPVTSYRIL